MEVVFDWITQASFFGVERPLHLALFFPLQSVFSLGSVEVYLLSPSRAPGDGCEVSDLSQGDYCSAGEQREGDATAPARALHGSAEEKQ